MASATSQRDVLLLAVLALAAYANAFQGSFQFDDYNVIIDNPQVQSLTAWWQAMPGIRPLLKLSYALNLASGLGLSGFHLVNLLVHAANGVLVYLLLRSFADRAGMGESGARAAWLAAALFVAHPLNSEAVTYISGRSASLATLFYLGALMAYIRQGKPGRRAAWLSPLLFAAALLVKETALILPLALLLWEAGDISRAFSLSDSLRRQKWHWTLLALGLVMLAASPTYHRLLETSWSLRPLGESLAAQPHAILYLVGQMLRLTALNADPALPTALPWTISTILETTAVVAALLFGLAQLRRRPWLGFGLLWFFLHLLPTQSLWPRLDTINERHFYLAGIGLFWLAGYGWARLAAGKSPRLWRTVAGLVLAVLVLATAARNTVYHDEIAFWQDVAAKSPHNPRAFNNLGYAYTQSGHTAEAENAYRRALALDPENIRASANLRALSESNPGQVLQHEAGP